MKLPRIQYPDGQVVQYLHHKYINIVPGSFNDLHAGHRYLYEQATKSGLPTFFEISRTNRDKPSLSDEEIYRRLKQFEWYAPIIINWAPLYRDKITFYRSFYIGATNTNFYVGSDTAARLLKDESVETIESWTDVVFYVSERLINGINPLTTMALPRNFILLPEADKSDELKRLSSTALRSKNDSRN